MAAVATLSAPVRQLTVDSARRAGVQYEVFITHDPSSTCPSQAGPNVIAISTASQVRLAHTWPSGACPRMRSGRETTCCVGVQQQCAACGPRWRLRRPLLSLISASPPQIYGAAVPLQPLQLVRLQPSVAEPCEAKQTCTGTAFDDAITYFRLDSIDHDSDVTIHVFTDDLHVCFYLGDATETGYRPSYLVATSYIGGLPAFPLSVLQRAGTDICACSGALRVGAAVGACS